MTQTNTLEQKAEAETNVVLKAEDEIKCAACGKLVEGAGYKERSLVYHSRTEAYKFREDLCSEF